LLTSFDRDARLHAVAGAVADLDVFAGKRATFIGEEVGHPHPFGEPRPPRS
jgi:hypothetical protein